MTCDAKEAALAYIRHCIENAEDVSSLEEELVAEEERERSYKVNLSQMPQLSQPTGVACSPSALAQELFEERAAIIEYDGKVPRKFAEFLARQKS